MSHGITHYILLAYNLFEGELGKVYWFLIPNSDMISIISEFGGYAHGTILKQGKITIQSIIENDYEYAIRPNPNITNPELWRYLVEFYEFNEDDLSGYFN